MNVENSSPATAMSVSDNGNVIATAIGNDYAKGMNSPQITPKIYLHTLNNADKISNKTGRRY